MSGLNNDYKEMCNHEKESTIQMIVEKIMENDMNNDSSCILKSKNFQDEEINSLLALLISQPFFTDENYNCIVQIISFIVSMKPISSFDNNLKYIFFDVASVIFNELCYSTKVYVSFLTLSLFLQSNKSNQDNLLQSYHNFFFEVSDINAILNQITNK